MGLTGYFEGLLNRHPAEAGRGRVMGRLNAMNVAGNVLLVLLKAWVGWMSGSVSVLGDALNNFSDCLSGVVAAIGVRAARKPADHRHPFGHARMEYVAATLVGAVILVAGYELGRASVMQILSPRPLERSVWLPVVLVLSIALKGRLFFLNRRFGVRCASTLLRALASDCLSDMCATSVVLIGMLCSFLTPLNVDGWGGLAVAAFVLYAGYGVIKETLNHILGTAPDPELVARLTAAIEADDDVLAVHDLIVHDYGPGAIYASAHAEVDARLSLQAAHHVLDAVERGVRQTCGVELVLHADPINRRDPDARKAYQAACTYVAADERLLDVHDFQTKEGAAGLMVSCDLCVDPHAEVDDGALRLDMEQQLAQQVGRPIRLRLILDRSYVSRETTDALDAGDGATEA